MMKRRTSEIWSFFRAVDDTFALCNICKAKLSYKTTTTNLSKHMHRMHPNNAFLSPRDKFKIEQSREKIKIEHRPTVDRNRGKPRNPAQEVVLVNFIKKHPRLLQNPTWDTRNSVEMLWEQLTSELNSHGPPHKDVATWKKALKDWKRFILKKVERNEMHNIPFETSLSSAEETIAHLSRMNDDFSQIIMSASEDEDYQVVSNAAYDVDVEDVVPEEDQDHNVLDTTGFDYEPEDTKTAINIDPLYLQSVKKSAVDARLTMAAVTEEDSTHMEIIGKDIELVNDVASSTHLALKEFCTLYKQKLTEDKRHHLAIEKLMSEKNELKRKFLEIEQRKRVMK